MTLTGRTGLWADIVKNASASPLVGVGFGLLVGPSGYDIRWIVVPRHATMASNKVITDTLTSMSNLASSGDTIFGVIAVSFTPPSVLQHNYEFGRIRLTPPLCIVLSNMTESSLPKGTLVCGFLPSGSRRSKQERHWDARSRSIQQKQLSS